MYFTKNEIIELNDGSRFLVIDTAIIDEVAYYKIEQLENGTKTGIKKYITADNNEGKLYINDKLDSSVIQNLDEICK